ncbi:MAG TPA: hypothetical protein DDZ51_11735 [Planctomycetaceae bacterium]|nr:hypothetical protein [Planctomycetaceae bacterium]
MQQEIANSLSPPPEKPASVEKELPNMGKDQQPLCNLYTSTLQHGGVEIDRFSTATGTLEGAAF